MIKNKLKKFVSRIKNITNNKSAKKNKPSKNNQKISHQSKYDKKISYKDFSINQIETELKREKYRSKYKKVLKNTIFTLIVVAAIATIIATFVLSILEINGSSMNPTLKEGQIVIAYKNKDTNKNDIIAFYHGNKILVKRVIAVPGDYVNITDDGAVYVNGKLIKEPYISEISLGNSNIEYPYQVPDGHYFVLGDKRDTSIDSRNSVVGAVSKEDILGKVVISIWPLNKMGIIK